MSLLASFGIALLVLVPLGLLCLWASYRLGLWLGLWLGLTDQFSTIVLGIGVFPLPFIIAFMVAVGILLHLFHLPHDSQYAAGGIAVGGWMGAGTARLENLKRQVL